VNNSSQYEVGFNNSMIEDMDGDIPSSLITFTRTMLHYALLGWQKKRGVHPKASKSTLRDDSPDCSYNFNYKADCHKIASYCAATDHKLLRSPGVADRYTFLMNTWSTLQESNQQRVYKTLLLQSSIGSNTRTTQRLLLSLAWKQRMLTIQFFLTI
jgi:hypothetical protein